MKRENRLAHREQPKEEVHSTQANAAAPLEFASAEEALRRDQQETAVPPGVAARLEHSIAQEPSSPPSWWRRLFWR
jgi:hypothetical protein